MKILSKPNGNAREYGRWAVNACATVYWKQSFREFIGGTPAHRLFNDDELYKIFDDYPNAVGPEWSMFNNNK